MCNFAKSLTGRGVNIKPGQKLCPTCRNLCGKKAEENDDSGSDKEDPDVKFTPVQIKKQSIEDANKTLEDLGCSPLKLHALPSHSKASYGKRKLEKVNQVLKEKVYRALDYSEVEDSDIAEGNVDAEMIRKAQDFDAMIMLMKDKVANVNRAKKIQMLTLAPPSWSKEKIMSEFNATEHIVRQARKLKNEKGILSIPEPKKGKRISDDIVKLVIDFYQHDEFSRMLPGAKDKVSIKRNVYMQKRLILCNLRELYSCFKWEHPPTIKINFSKFCTLRPKWCILADSAGTHSVCVCSIHQNVKLLLDAIKIEETYKDLIKFLVCDSENPNCMLRHCDKCPTDEKLSEILKQKLDYLDDDDEIEYSQWMNTDRPDLVKQSVSVEEYITLLIKKLQALIPHSFISKCQAKSLKNMKENLTSDKAILLMDFAENYTFVIQNEIQSYHWSRSGCTLHPVCIYIINEENELKVLNHCFISDDMEHDVGFVYAVQKDIMAWLTQHYPQVRKVHYFTDGCAAQYKNRKSFKNLCEHKNDFSIDAEHSFFATSHGKSVCDGLGGTVKRTLRKASLQLPDDQQIKTASGVYNFCKEKIDNITFHFLDKTGVDLLRNKLEDRFGTTRTIPGTRSFHNYKPLSSDLLEIRRVTESEKPSLVFSFSEEAPKWTSIRPQPNCFVSAVYDDRWYFALVKNVCDEEEDAELIFLHPPGPAVSFFWPNREDCCFVPLDNILCIVSVPETSSSGRTYYFAKNDVKLTELNFSKWLKYIQATYRCRNNTS